MKRCPQCEFIYEDDQTLCDMDGVLLVFDGRTLPNLGALATVSGPVPDKGQRRSRMVPAFATLLLMLAIASVYYVTTLRHATNDFTPASLTAPAPEPPTEVTEAPAVIPEQATPITDANEVQPPAPRPAEKTQTASAPKPAAAPARKAVTQPAANTAKPEPKKDDSKVGSILKKTGKILKKPFKF